MGQSFYIELLYHACPRKKSENGKTLQKVHSLYTPNRRHLRRKRYRLIAVSVVRTSCPAARIRHFFVAPAQYRIFVIAARHFHIRHFYNFFPEFRARRDITVSPEIYIIIMYHPILGERGFDQVRFSRISRLDARTLDMVRAAMQTLCVTKRTPKAKPGAAASIWNGEPAAYARSGL